MEGTTNETVYDTSWTKYRGGLYTFTTVEAAVAQALACSVDGVTRAEDANSTVVIDGETRLVWWPGLGYHELNLAGLPGDTKVHDELRQALTAVFEQQDLTGHVRLPVQRVEIMSPDGKGNVQIRIYGDRARMHELCPMPTTRHQ